MSGLARTFGATPALVQANLAVQEREIHGLVGPSGAGKSTLLRIVSGLDRPEGGEIVYRGYPIQLRNRRDAFRIGIAVVAQEPALVPDLSVLDNLAMPLWGRIGRSEPADLRGRAATLLASLCEAPPALDQRAATLTRTQAHLVEIVRALVVRAKLYLFDDAFATLPSREAEALAGIMARLRLSGCGVVVTARSTADLLRLADRVTVLEEGRTVLSGQAAASARAAFEPAEERPAPPASAIPPALPPLLAVRSLAAPGGVSSVSLTVRPGEIRALHGLKGCGRAAILAAIAGLTRRHDGEVILDGIALGPGSIRQAARAGLAYLPAAAGLPLPSASARRNLDLLGGRAPGWDLAEVWRLLGLPAAALDEMVAAQPSGIRRRIALAGAMLAGRRALVLDDPLRGLDPTARQAGREALRAAAARGCAVLASWGDPVDLLEISDTVTLIRDGRTAGDVPTALLDGEALALLATPEAGVRRGAGMLADLARENGGAAFWALRRDGHLVCLGAAVADGAADPGLAAGRAVPFASTRIATALAHGPEGFVCEPDGSRSTLLVPVASRTGRPMGLIGLTVPSATHPPAAAVAFHIETLAAKL